MMFDLELTGHRAFVASPRAAAVTETEYIIDGGTVPTA